MLNWTLDKWKDSLCSVYRNHNQKRVICCMWLSVDEYAGKIAEAVRRSEIKDLSVSIAHVFCWLSCFVAKSNYEERVHPLYRFEDPFCDIVSFKFPNRCGHCKHNPCICGLQTQKLEYTIDKLPDCEALLNLRKQFRLDYKKWPLDRWLQMFEDIYGNANYASPLEIICFHFQEEVSEAATMLRKLNEHEGKLYTVYDDRRFRSIKGLMDIIKSTERNVRMKENDKKELIDLCFKKIKLAVEIADCFSWLCAIFVKLRFMYRGLSEMLSRPLFASFVRAVMNEYENPKKRNSVYCPRCEHSRCCCPLYLP